MYGGQPPPHPHQLHNVQQPFDAVSAGLHVEPHPQAVMDASHLNAFAYPFQGVHDPSAMMSFQDQPNVARHGPFATEGISPTQPMPPGQAHPEPHGAMNAPRASFDAGQGPRKLSVTASDDSQREQQQQSQSKGPLSADSIDEDAADEFELSGRSRADGTDLGGKAKDGSKADAPPPWSELKTKAGKDRKRLPLACIACRRKKIRCSGEKPACKHCLRSRIPCVYKVTTRKAAPRTDYMAMLDKRLKRMEERIIKVIPKSDQDATSPVTRAVVKPAIPGMLPGVKAGSKKRGADEAFGPSLDAWAKAPTKTGTGINDAVTPSPDEQDADENQLFQEGSDALPSKEIQEHLAEVYFDNVYGQAYHLLHKPSYMRKLKNNTLPPVLILSVCAVAARFSASPKLSSSTRQFLRGEEWAAPARDICTKRYESPNITILTCLLILGLHEFGTCQGGRSWALGGQAIRMAFALQLHKDLEYDPLSRNGQTKLSFVDREIRRRIMWSCFIMDRFNSSGEERPMFIKEDVVNIPLPVKERNFLLDMPAITETLSGDVSTVSAPASDEPAKEARDNLGVAASLIRCIAIWGRIVAYVNQGGKEKDSNPMWSPTSEFGNLSKEADDFSRSLPEALQYHSDNLTLHHSRQTGNHFLLLHIAIQQNILFINRNALLSGGRKPGEFVSVARSKVSAAANWISEILRDAESARLAVTAPFAAYCAFSSTTAHIRGIVSGDPSAKATAEANSTTNIRYIRKMMRYWGMFHWMEENIRAQYRNAMDRSRSGLEIDESALAAPILQYGDWFNRYPHGISDADFMDPAARIKKEKGADGVLEQKPELQSVEDFVTTLSSPKTNEPREGPPAPMAKRKSVAKRRDGTPTRAVSKQHPIPGPGPNVPSVPEQMTPRGVQQAQQPPPRRASMPVNAHGSGPAPFNPITAPHSQSSAYHTMSPISPVNVEQFHHTPQAQQGFFQSNMMHMGMPQQPNAMMQPINQNLSFGSYSMESGNMPNEQGFVNGAAPGWNNATGSVPAGQQMQAQAPGGGMGMGQHPHGPATPNGVNSHVNGGDGWFIPFDLQPSEVSHNMGVNPENTDTFSSFYSGAGMGSQNPLGGLRHAH